MNDRFKFRVYYKPHNKVYNVICLNCDRQNEIVIEYKGSTAIIEWENCEIIQSTGLKDKNGKLIYERDIVIEHYYNTKETAIKKVFFDEKVIGFAYTDGIEYNQLSIADGDRLQVIGNIYENADLLESEE